MLLSDGLKQDLEPKVHMGDSDMTFSVKSFEAYGLIFIGLTVCEQLFSERHLKREYYTSKIASCAPPQSIIPRPEVGRVQVGRPSLGRLAKSTRTCSPADPLKLHTLRSRPYHTPFLPLQTTLGCLKWQMNHSLPAQTGPAKEERDKVSLLAYDAAAGPNDDDALMEE